MGTNQGHLTPAGNQVGLIRLPVERLAELVGSPYESTIWPGLETPLSAERVRGYVEAEDTFAPARGRMGDELGSHEEHERRVAWLYRHPAYWSPIALIQDGGDVSSTLVMQDGYHRLAAALLLGADLEALVQSGQRSRITALLKAAEGQWVWEPESEIFGRGVFPFSLQGCSGAVRVFGEGRRCWVEDVATGECLARYGDMLWTVTPASSGEPAEERYFAMRQPGTPLHDHAEGFVSTCELVLGMPGSGMGDFARKIINDE